MWVSGNVKGVEGGEGWVEWGGGEGVGCGEELDGWGWEERERKWKRKGERGKGWEKEREGSSKAKEKISNGAKVEQRKRSKAKRGQTGQIYEDGTMFGGFEKAELREAKKEAEMGYMTMNLASPPGGAYWGRFNDRVVNEEWVKSLMEAYNLCLDNCLDGTAVDVAVKKSWIANVSEMVGSVEGKSVKTVAQMEFTEAGKEEIGKDNLWILGGNHRRQALLRHLEGRQKVLDKMKTQLSRKEAKGGEEDEEVESMRKEVRSVEEKIATDSMWAVRLYDREKIEAHVGAKATALYRFLSRNEMKDTRLATEEELMIEIVDELKDAYEEDVKLRKDRGKNLDAAAVFQTFMKKAKRKAAAFKESRDRAGYRELCAVPSFALGLVAASWIRRHYTHARWFQVAELVKMLESHGAEGKLISEFIVESVETLERVANPEKPPMAYERIEELGQHLLEANTEAEVDEIREKLEKVRTAFEEMGDASDWTHELLDKIDQCFKDAYCVNDEPCESLFVPLSSDNDNRFEKYLMSVDKVLQNESQTAPPYAREYFAYAMMWKLHGYKFPMPLGTASVVEALHKIAMRYPRGISEWSNAVTMVISWIGTGLHWVPKMGSKVYIVYDAFDAALDSASKDILIKQNAIGVRRKIIRVLIAHLTTSVVEVDTYLMSCPMPRSMVTDLSAFKFASALAPDNTKGKAPKHQRDPDDPLPPVRDATVVAEFLAAVGWTSDRLTREFTKVNAVLTATKDAFTRDQRLSPHVGTRLLTMSALPRNLDSQNKKCDYALITTAIAVESALVDKYRAHLLSICPGARDLRDDLHSFFFSITMPHAQYLPDGKKEVTRVWEFPDAVRSDSAASGVRVRDIKSLSARWLAAKESYLKEKKDPVQSIIQNLEKNRFLLCSDTTVPAGTVETLAHHLISGLAEIMYKNKARIAHASNHPDADDAPLFDMSSVLVPSIPRAPHDVTEHYRDHLGYNRWSFHPSTYAKDPPARPSPSTSAPHRPSRSLPPISSLPTEEEEDDPEHGHPPTDDPDHHFPPIDFDRDDHHDPPRSSPTPAQRRNPSPAPSSLSPHDHDSDAPSQQLPHSKRSPPTSPENKRPSKKVAQTSRNSSKRSKKPPSSKPRPRPIVPSSSSLPPDFVDNAV
ncbi:hypothetical protein H4582DRAFT_2063460 [Lactarius indigo]|nr:hypothetical protein H4582DRAFT_2063460 [Lactarius indigo]